MQGTYQPYLYCTTGERPAIAQCYGSERLRYTQNAIAINFPVSASNSIVHVIVVHARQMGLHFEMEVGGETLSRDYSS